jgi:hypothetical protein
MWVLWHLGSQDFGTCLPEIHYGTDVWRPALLGNKWLRKRTAMLILKVEA